MLEVLLSAIQSIKENGIQIKKEEVKLLLFTNGIIINVEKPDKSSENKTQDLREFYRVREYRKNTHPFYCCI